MEGRRRRKINEGTVTMEQAARYLITTNSEAATALTMLGMYMADEGIDAMGNEATLREKGKPVARIRVEVKVTVLQDDEEEDEE